MPRVGVVLSGCGFLDGAEIHEAVLTLLAIARGGATAVCMAPNVAQRDVVNHLTGQPVPGETRNVLVEAARIARGEIRDLATVRGADVDALALPGGYGAAKNLCSFAVDGPKATVHPDVARLVREVHEAGKPIAAICIAPATLAACFRGQPRATVTIGTDAATASAVEALGASHKSAVVREVVVDEANRVVTTPAYMLARDVAEAATGIEKAIQALLRMIPKGSPARASVGTR
ncbi:MAG: isoprenoid biosynthesis glyoxalase ElbB [Planctomycetales bacterium]|nr:isoprenoid biosynthesis glyoxalase ElbB [Planctomycetales bacterium]